MEEFLGPLVLQSKAPHEVVALMRAYRNRASRVSARHYWIMQIA
jgi:hypothetical protein